MRRCGVMLATRYMYMHLWPDIEPSCCNMYHTGIESGRYEKLVTSWHRTAHLLYCTAWEVPTVEGKFNVHIYSRQCMHFSSCLHMRSRRTLLDCERASACSVGCLQRRRACITDSCRLRRICCLAAIHCRCCEFKPVCATSVAEHAATSSTMVPASCKSELCSTCFCLAFLSFPHPARFLCTDISSVQLARRIL